MRAKIISLSIALLLGMAAWADDVWNYNVYGDCNKNGYVGIENGYQWVDLGLPSGIKWATCNVGAEKPEDYGNYYAWGETAPKTDYSWETYKYANGDYDKLTKYCNEASYGDNGFTDDKTTLESADDAATANLGEEWRMPTDAEWTELRKRCTWTYTTQNGVNGYLVASKTNSNSIFPPRCGLPPRHAPQPCRLRRQLLVFVARRGLPEQRVERLLRFGLRVQGQQLPLLRLFCAPCLSNFIIRRCYSHTQGKWLRECKYDYMQHRAASECLRRT